MWNLFKAELLRFRTWVIAFAALHLLVLAFLTRVVDLAQQPLLVYRVFGAAYALAGLLLGLYQMGGYRRPSVWLNLLHRPLPNGKIAAALLAAGIVALAVALAMPILALAGQQALTTARVVDARHWLLPLATLLIVACGYLAGAYCALANRRYAACALVPLILLGIGGATGTGALALQALVLLWLAVMVAAVFRPDRSAPLRSAPLVIATALPLQMGVYLLILLLGFGVEMLWIMQGSHANNAGTPPPGGHNESERMSGRDRMLAGLATSAAPEASLWREQVSLSEIYGVGTQVEVAPVRNELTNVMPMEFDDGERRLRWVFSHDSMRYEGYGLADRRRAGVLGVGPGHAVFPAPALAAGDLPGLREGDAVLLAGDGLYQYASESRQVRQRMRLPAGEILAGVAPVGESVGVISDRALYFFDTRAVLEDDGMLTPRQRVPIPGAFGDLRDLDLIELVGGYLVSFSFTRRPDDLLGAAPYQTLLRVDDAGRAETVAQRAIAYDYPALHRYRAWWPSPAMYALRQAATGLFAGVDPLRATNPPPVPRSMRALAGALMLLSLLAALWLTRRQALSVPARAAWVLSCGLIGLPALASLWLLYPQRVPAQAQTHLDPVTA
ncbi:hypothetical protein [Luteimonas sp. R10]|uniref:hypothetical protein n=1 Tax=Luteimonas sp. R10 TaxID=3108176 RepID=UPI0030883789|nr:hypothetical protein U3649_03755 [Luteimonas sp. R10]